MTNKLELYRCATCGNIVEILHGGGAELHCCGAPMTLEIGNTTDAAKEKHVPVIEKTPTGFKVTVGSVLHPMEEKHYIEWIELIADDISYIKFLSPGQTPEAEFCVNATKVTAREFCNVHGHWKANN